MKDYFVQVLAVFSAAAVLVVGSYNPAEYIDDELPLIFTSTMRIHPDMPEFTFHRIVEDYLPESFEIWIPAPREVSIIIEDEDGNIVQEITGLTQSNDWDRVFHANISFDDYNFDEYLDMRLLRWQDGAGGLLANEYFWLWDAYAGQFVMNEQLMEIGVAADMRANQETQQIERFNRGDNMSQIWDLYEYSNGEFTRIAHYHTRFQFDPVLAQRYYEITRTDGPTGEVTVENVPTGPRGFISDDWVEPDQTIVQRVEIGPGVVRIARMDAWRRNDWVYGFNEYDVEIRIWDEWGDRLQEITDIWASYDLRSANWVWILEDNPLNFHFADYDGDGFLDMGLRRSPGGSLRNDPHYYWLWVPEVGWPTSGQFVENRDLMMLSLETAVSPYVRDGYIRSYYRITMGHDVWLTYVIEDGEMVRVRREETRYSSQRAQLADATDWRMEWIGLREFIVTDYRAGTTTIEVWKEPTSPARHVRLDIVQSEVFQEEVDITITVMCVDRLTVHQVIEQTIFGFGDLQQFDWHFADYSNNGYFDMAIRSFPGGSMGNDPHIYWLWDAASQQFVLNEAMTNHSSLTNIRLLENGDLRSFHRDGQLRWWLTHRFMDGDFTLVRTEFYDMQAMTVTIHDHLTGETLVLSDPLE